MNLRIVCAANKSQTGLIVIGLRHYDQYMVAQMEHFPFEAWGYSIQGFLDNQRNFLTREEAYVVASEANQIIRRCGGDEHKLFSENLY